MAHRFKAPQPLTQNPLAPKKIQQDIFAALQDQPFPVRGWHLTMSFDKANPHLYPVLSEKSELDGEGVPKEKAPVLFNLPSKELLLTADFRMEACYMLCGKPWKCPDQVKDDQWCRFANTNGQLEIIVDARCVPPYQEKLVYPMKEEWEERVQYWSRKWEASGKTDAQARWVLVQLDGIRNSGNHVLYQCLGRLVQRIQKEVPDFWFLAELAMTGRLTDEEIKAVHEHPVGKGGLIVRTFQRPTTEPTGKLQ